MWLSLFMAEVIKWEALHQFQLLFAAFCEMIVWNRRFQLLASKHWIRDEHWDIWPKENSCPPFSSSPTAPTGKSSACVICCISCSGCTELCSHSSPLNKIHLCSNFSTLCWSKHGFTLGLKQQHSLASSKMGKKGQSNKKKIDKNSSDCVWMASEIFSSRNDGGTGPCWSAGLFYFLLYDLSRSGLWFC